MTVSALALAPLLAGVVAFATGETQTCSSVSEDGVTCGREEVTNSSFGEFGDPIFEFARENGADVVGIRHSTWPPEPVYVDRVLKGSWAEDAGVKKNDEIIRVNGVPISEMKRESLMEAFGGSPLHLSVRRFPSELSEEAVLRRFGANRCHLAEGNEFPWSPMVVSLRDALVTCRSEPDCRGVTGSPGNSFKDGFRQKVQWHFKQRSKCTPSDDWISVVLFNRDTVEPSDPFTPPSRDVWRDIPHSTYLSEDPVIIQFDDFVSQDEADHLIKLGDPLLRKSVVRADRSIDNSERTSMTAWLDDQKHQRDPILRAIDERIEALTNVEPRNMESYQVLWYKEGDYYRLHHDHIEEQRQQPCGIRIGTFYIYLNDVEEGGSTTFPALGLEVKPARGRALLWWSMSLEEMGSSPGELNRLDIDPRVKHAAERTVNGTKWGANKWLHASDFANNLRLNRLN